MNLNRSTEVVFIFFVRLFVSDISLLFGFYVGVLLLNGIILLFKSYFYYQKFADEYFIYSFAKC